MDPLQFSASSPGQSVNLMNAEDASGKKRRTFLLNPLYPAFELTVGVQRLIEDVTFQLGRLDAMTR